MNETAEVERSLGSGAYTQRGISLVRGQGVYVWDDTGRKYLDCITGHGAAILGHAHPAIQESVSEQSRTLMTCPGAFANDKRAEFLTELIGVMSRNTNGDYGNVFLCNSGTEAVEAAIKIARYQTGKPGIVAVRNGFHGRTMGALSLTWSKKYREPFQPLIPGVRYIPINDLQAAEEAITGETGAVVVEPIQGEGGVVEMHNEFLSGLSDLCDAAGARLIFDEVQTGFGRTGDWFAFHSTPVTPDIVALAKGIAGGIPMGAAVMRSGMQQLSSGAHGSTFGGNPLACAAGLGVIRTIRERGLVRRSRELGEFAREHLEEHLAGSEMVREIRGRGLMIGIQLRRRVTPVLKALMKQGILAMPAGSTVLRLLPPLIIGKTELKKVLDSVESILTEKPVVESGNGGNV